MSVAMLIAGFDDQGEADASLDRFDGEASDRGGRLPMFGLVSGQSTALTTTTIADLSRTGPIGVGSLLRLLVRLARSTPERPRVGGVVWGAAAAVGRLATDNPAMRALSRAVEECPTVLVALGDEMVIAEWQRHVRSRDVRRYRVPEETTMLVGVLASLALEDLDRRPVPIA